jgi:hypothetical protein
MAVLDHRAVLADATSVAAAAGTANIGSQYDLGVAKDIGNGEPLYLALVTTTSIITGGAAGTIAFQLASDSTDSIATNGSQSIHWKSKDFVTDDDALNALDAGTVIAVVPLPLDGAVPYERFLGVQAVIATTTVTAGAITAVLTHDPNFSWKAYKQATR